MTFYINIITLINNNLFNFYHTCYNYVGEIYERLISKMQIMP